MRLLQFSAVLTAFPSVSGFAPQRSFSRNLNIGRIYDSTSASGIRERDNGLYETPGKLYFEKLIESVNGNADDTQEDKIKAVAQAEEEHISSVELEGVGEEPGVEAEKDELTLFDEMNMERAIQLVLENGGDDGATSAYPGPTTGALLVSDDGTILGQGCSDYSKNSIEKAMQDAGLDIIPLQEWCVTWPKSDKLRNSISNATLYLTMEPSHQRRGQALPPMTQLIELSGVRRVVIGCQDPIPELATKGASALHSAGIEVTMEAILVEDCRDLIKEYSERANGKLHRMARNHFDFHKRPLGFLHCSVVDSDNLEAFANHGNSFGQLFDGKRLSFRDFGAYEIAPPPEVIWADSQSADDFNVVEFDEDEESEDIDEILSLEFDDENRQESLGGNPMMPWYEQVDAVVGTFPHPGNGPVDDDSVKARLNGLKWLSTYGATLPPGVERILVMDATDLEDLPLNNDDPNLPKGVDVEKFWKGEGRKPTRVLLRRGRSAQAQSAAKVAAEAAAAASKSAQAALEAIETGDAESAAKAALEGQQAATAASELAQKELMRTLELKRKLTDLGTVVETLTGGEPIDVMNHLGMRNGYQSVVWRAGCWGSRGVSSILAGAFQWVSAHLAVDATGGKFWQLMLAERAVQGACGPESKVKVFAAQEDINLEYCDEPGVDGDCSLTIDGRPVRHVRLDCRVALVDPDRPRDFVLHKTKPLDRHIIEEEAPWFL